MSSSSLDWRSCVRHLIFIQREFLLHWITILWLHTVAILPGSQAAQMTHWPCPAAHEGPAKEVTISLVNTHTKTQTLHHIFPLKTALTEQNLWIWSLDLSSLSPHISGFLIKAPFFSTHTFFLNYWHMSREKPNMSLVTKLLLSNWKEEK